MVATALNSTSVEVKWTAPSGIKGRDVIKRYFVFVLRVKINVSDGNNLVA